MTKSKEPIACKDTSLSSFCNFFSLNVLLFGSTCCNDREWKIEWCWELCSVFKIISMELHNTALMVLC